MFRHDFERGYADGRNIEGKRKAAGGCNADTDAGKGAGTDGDGKPVDIRKGKSRLIQRAIDDTNQMFSMSDGRGATAW